MAAVEPAVVPSSALFCRSDFDHRVYLAAEDFVQAEISASVAMNPKVIATTSNAPTMRGGAGTGMSNQRHAAPIPSPSSSPIASFMAPSARTRAARRTGPRTALDVWFRDAARRDR